MMQRSTSLERLIERETVRLAGSLARLHFYRGTMPLRCELVADGERIEGVPVGEAVVRDLAQGHGPLMPSGATYWRLMDNNGNVVLQGDEHG